MSTFQLKKRKQENNVFALPPAKQLKRNWIFRTEQRWKDSRSLHLWSSYVQVDIIVCYGVEINIPSIPNDWKLWPDLFRMIVYHRRIEMIINSRMLAIVIIPIRGTEGLGRMLTRISHFSLVKNRSDDNRQDIYPHIWNQNWFHASIISQTKNRGKNKTLFSVVIFRIVIAIGTKRASLFNGHMFCSNNVNRVFVCVDIYGHTDMSAGYVCRTKKNFYGITVRVNKNTLIARNTFINVKWTLTC